MDCFIPETLQDPAESLKVSIIEHAHKVLAISEIKVMVVLPTIQAVYDFGQLLRARAKTQKTALGKG